MTVCNPVLNGNTIFYTVQPGLGFLADDYYKARQMCHTGIDLNDTRGGDSDLGAPVYAAADGVVIDAASYRGWGNIIVIHHPALGVWTMYAHLSRMDTRSGAPVTMGQQIGAIGKGDKGQFWAHLHFEVRKIELPSYEWPSNQIKDRASCEAWIRERYLDPEAWLAQQKAMKTLSEVEAYRSPPTPTPPITVKADHRVLISQGGATFQDATGSKVTIQNAKTVVINATGEDTWIRVG